MGSSLVSKLVKGYSIQTLLYYFHIFKYKASKRDTLYISGVNSPLSFTAVKTKLFHYYFPRPNLVSFVSLVQQLLAWPSVRQTSIPLWGFLADPSAPRRDVYGHPPSYCTVLYLNLWGANRGENKQTNKLNGVNCKTKHHFSNHNHTVDDQS